MSLFSTLAITVSAIESYQWCMQYMCRCARPMDSLQNKLPLGPEVVLLMSAYGPRLLFFLMRRVLYLVLFPQARFILQLQVERALCVTGIKVYPLSVSQVGGGLEKDRYVCWPSLGLAEPSTLGCYLGVGTSARQNVRKSKKMRCLA
jgi:hypothetical protein